MFNSLAPCKFEWNFKHVIFKRILVIDGWGISCEISLIWMSLDFTDDQSTLVQVMAWCRQATSHYLIHVDPDRCRHTVSLGPNELNINFSSNYTFFIIWFRYFVRNFKGCLWNSIQNILPIDWNIRFSYNVENLRALTFRSVYAFFNSPKSNRHYIQCTGI